MPQVDHLVFERSAVIEALGHVIDRRTVGAVVKEEGLG
jgi:hypothetical protein